MPIALGALRLFLIGTSLGIYHHQNFSCGAHHEFTAVLLKMGTDGTLESSATNCHRYRMCQRCGGDTGVVALPLPVVMRMDFEVPWTVVTNMISMFLRCSSQESS